MNSDHKRHLLIIDDEENMRHMLSVLCEGAGYLVNVAADGSEGLRMVEDNIYDFILCDLKMPKMNGMEFLEKAKNFIGTTTVIMMSAYGTIDMAIEAMKLGAYDFISKPFKTDEVLLALKKAEEREVLKRENLRLKNQILKIEGNYNFGNMVAKNKEMQNLFALATKVAQFNTTVLITGESGTGKELVARGIHYSGPRAKMPLVAVNCGGIPENLLESELFGHAKGSFTGADRNKKGLFEEANNGTIFLDEIGELPLALQVKLLRVLQENKIRPVGSNIEKEIDARVIAATAKNLEEEIHKGAFREDLFYRLNVMPIKLPPLRERMDDIPLLCQIFIEKFNKKLNCEIKGVAPAAMSFLMRHKWSGNIRELENVIERSMVMAEESVIIPGNLPQELGFIGQDSGDLSEMFSGYSLKEAKKSWEKRYIIKALKTTDGNRSKAATLLEISFPSLLNKIKEYDITVP
ncbi:MAG: sigma-54 dependent transcriptional regulator [Proteobacteria bacterium]|nr:sigma-54 dependent transcriptional regulator [Pseudomonadota bacterium]MBU1714758.1 sigma-54 dependent transcriptional regulator [Pseudomonadota bacterium]